MSGVYQSLQALTTLTSLLGTNKTMVLLPAGNDGSQGTTATLAEIALSDLTTFITAGVQTEITALQAKPGNGAFVTPITITLTGPITGSVTFDGTSNQTLPTAVTDASINQSAIIGLSASLASLQADADSKLATSLLGAANGVAGLDSTGHVPAAQLPSYVDDVLEFATQSVFPTTGETGKIYVDLSTNHIFRWSGTVYIEIDSSVGSADTATRWATARTLTLSGQASGSVTFDGSANFSLTVALGDITPTSVVTGGALTVTGITSLLAGSTSVKRSGSMDSVTDFQISNAAQYISFFNNISSGSYNPNVQAGDHAIIYSNGTSGTGSLVIAPWSANNGGLRIDSTGAVSVNTTGTNGLNVISSSTNSTGLSISNTATNGRQWTLGSSGGGPVAAGGFVLYDNTAGATRFSVDTSGYVSMLGGYLGIGTAPAANLDVLVGGGRLMVRSTGSSLTVDSVTTTNSAYAPLTMSAAGATFNVGAASFSSTLSAAGITSTLGITATNGRFGKDGSNAITIDGSNNTGFTSTTLYQSANQNWSLATNGKYWNFNSDGSMSIPGNLTSSLGLYGSLVQATNATVTTFSSQSAGGNFGLVAHSANANAAMITFIRDGAFGAYLGYDTSSNDLRLGGWSLGANSYRIAHEGLSNPNFSGIMSAAAFTNNVNVLMPTPNSSASTAAFRANGNYGGGFGLVDGAYGISMYSIAGALNFGFGSNTAVTSQASIDAGGQFISAGSSAYKFRMIQGGYGAVWYQDGSNMYCLLTNINDQYGGYNALRPFYVNLAGGGVYMYQGVSIQAGLTVAGGTTTDILNATTRIYTGFDSGVANSVSCSQWFRSTGQTGWYSSTYGGGWYMTDATYMRSYNNLAVVASDFVISSDERLKVGMRPFEYNGRLTPYHYAMKADGKTSFGFSAQEVQRLYPEAVGIVPDTGMLQLSYSKLTAVLSCQLNAAEDALKSLRQEFDTFKEDVMALFNKPSLWKRLTAKKAAI